jgi:DNA-binding winged helix-turn-helix (wHTH) protein
MPRGAASRRCQGVPHAANARGTESVWGPQYGKEMHYLKVYAYRLRRKLHDEGGRFLQSDPSVGYRLIPPGETGTDTTARSDKYA